MTFVYTKLALEKTGAARLVLAGGVAANRLLRERLNTELGVQVHMPPMSLCIDNGAMIAAAGISRLKHGLTGDLRATPNPNLPLFTPPRRRLPAVQPPTRRRLPAVQPPTPNPTVR